MQSYLFLLPNTNLFCIGLYGPTANQLKNFCAYAPLSCHEVEYLFFSTLAG